MLGSAYLQSLATALGAFLKASRSLKLAACCCCQVLWAAALAAALAAVAAGLTVPPAWLLPGNITSTQDSLAVSQRCPSNVFCSWKTEVHVCCIAEQCSRWTQQTQQAPCSLQCLHARNSVANGLHQFAVSLVLNCKDLPCGSAVVHSADAWAEQ